MRNIRPILNPRGRNPTRLFELDDSTQSCLAIGHLLRAAKPALKQIPAPPAPPARATRSWALTQMQRSKPRCELAALDKARIYERPRAFDEQELSRGKLALN